MHHLHFSEVWWKLHKDATLFWTNPGGNTQQNSSCTATYFPSCKSSKWDEEDIFCWGSHDKMSGYWMPSRGPAKSNGSWGQMVRESRECMLPVPFLSNQSPHLWFFLAQNIQLRILLLVVEHYAIKMNIIRCYLLPNSTALKLYSRK